MLFYLVLFSCFKLTVLVEPSILLKCSDDVSIVIGEVQNGGVIRQMSEGEPTALIGPEVMQSCSTEKLDDGFILNMDRKSPHKQIELRENFQIWFQYNPGNPDELILNKTNYTAVKILNAEVETMDYVGDCESGFENNTLKDMQCRSITSTRRNHGYISSIFKEIKIIWKKINSGKRGAGDGGSKYLFWLFIFLLAALLMFLIALFGWCLELLYRRYLHHQKKKLWIRKCMQQLMDKKPMCCCNVPSGSSTDFDTVTSTTEDDKVAHGDYKHKKFKDVYELREVVSNDSNQEPLGNDKPCNCCHCTNKHEQCNCCRCTNKHLKCPCGACTQKKNKAIYQKEVDTIEGNKKMLLYRDQDMYKSLDEPSKRCYFPYKQKTADFATNTSDVDGNRCCCPGKHLCEHHLAQNNRNLCVKCKEPVVKRKKRIKWNLKKQKKSEDIDLTTKACDCKMRLSW